MRPWILYSALRVGVFVVLFALLYALTASIGLEPAWLISAITAAVLALCISYIFFTGLRHRIASDVAAARSGTDRAGAVRAGTVKAGSDEAAEDAARGD